MPYLSLATAGPAFCWAVALVPALMYPCICWSYWRVVSHKRLVIKDLLRTQRRLDLYIRAYAPAAQAQREPFTSLFDITYHLQSYILAIAVNMVVAVGAAALGLARAGLPVLFPDDVTARLAAVPLPVVTGIAGGYLWGIYDILRRYAASDLSCVSLHFVWLRLFFAGTLGALVGTSARDPVGTLIAFLLGALPLGQLVDLARSRARIQLAAGQDDAAVEPPTLHKLQGMTRDVIERLADEGIRSTEHLAYADPVRLLLRTSFEWKTILDFIDQAALYNYVGDKLPPLRAMGFRGAIEVADLTWDFDQSPGSHMPDPVKLLDAVAGALGQEPLVVMNLIQTLDSDPHIRFLRELWTQATSAETATNRDDLVAASP